MGYDVKKLKELFDKEYKNLCEKEDNVPGYRDAVKEGDDLIQRHPMVVSKFAAYRMDFLSSDREVAAFAFAFRKYEQEVNSK